MPVIVPPISTAGKWDPLATPSSPHASDDEFRDSSIDGSWVDWDPAGISTNSEDAAGLLISASASATQRWFGLGKALPAGDICVTTRVHVGLDRIDTATGSGAAAGIAVCGDLSGAPTTAGFTALFLGENPSSASSFTTGTYIANQSWTDYDSFGTDHRTISQASGTLGAVTESAYVRFRRLSGSYSWEISRDGMAWWVIGAGGPAAANYVALVGTTRGSTQLSARFEFIRFDTTHTARTDVCYGRRV